MEYSPKRTASHSVSLGESRSTIICEALIEEFDRVLGSLNPLKFKPSNCKQEKMSSIELFLIPMPLIEIEKQIKNNKNRMKLKLGQFCLLLFRT